MATIYVLRRPALLKRPPRPGRHSDTRAQRFSDLVASVMPVVDFDDRSAEQEHAASVIAMDIAFGRPGERRSMRTV